MVGGGVGDEKLNMQYFTGSELISPSKYRPPACPSVRPSVSEDTSRNDYSDLLDCRNISFLRGSAIVTT